MNTLFIDYGEKTVPIKPLNAVNNGPVLELHRENPFKCRNNLELYKSMNIPYARLHDTPFFADYGGDHVVDIHLIFRDFDADVDEPSSYDFACTDQLLKVILMADTKPFYRLGCSIEGHLCKKYAIYPPKDFLKWAKICEHIIAHYNEGWADGFRLGIEFWEIWNEPNAVDMWLGTPEQYYDLYVTASKHLKARFPEIKIGGPALCNLDGIDSWVRPFLEKVKNENAPLDFFSWHGYTLELDYIKNKLRESRELLDEYGFTKTENILNEWNYAKDFTIDEYKTVLSIKSAAFAMAYMSVCQDGPLDMLMYYDARPTGFNNLFDSIFFEPLKGYYVNKLWGEMQKNNALECRSVCEEKDVYLTAAKTDEKEYAIITYYTDKKNEPNKTVSIKLKNSSAKTRSIFVHNAECDMKEIGEIAVTQLDLELEPNTIVAIISK